MGAQRGIGGLVLGLFFCSGATALVYEVIWSKYLAQMLGSTVQAQTVVLAVFMGGLALGNHCMGARADRVRSPVRVYGVFELLIGLYAFIFPNVFSLADRFFTFVGARVSDQGWVLLLLKGGISLFLLLGPTVLMGGTLPFLAAWLQKSMSEAGRRSARFYSVNSLGAVAGAGLAGFYLVPAWGMVSALQMTALLNVIIGALALRVGPTPQNNVEKQSCRSSDASAAPPAFGLKWAAGLVAITGGVSMGLEVLASRSLSLIFGASLQSFAVVLMAFILGIGLGSAWIASSNKGKEQRERVLVILLTSAAVWIAVLVFWIEWWVEIYRVARTGLGRSTTGYVFHQLLTGWLSIVVLGVPAGLIGAVLPLLIRRVAEESSFLGKSVGRLLTWNTLGAVTGVLITGFFIMPRFGLRNAFGILAAVLVAVACGCAWRWKWRPGMILSGSACFLLLLFFVVGGHNWRHVMSSGVFRARETEVDFSALDQRKAHVQILFYEDAADASVSVETGDGVGASREVSLRINGKTDATSHGDLATQLLLGHLPFLARPESKDVFVLGLGSGITAGAATAHPIRRLTIAENCEPVIRAARLFDQWNRGVLTNAVTTVCREDARTVLKLDPRRYDVIITEPSNPWMAGVGSVFSREYYQLAAQRLQPGGLMVQWFHLYDMHDGIVRLVLRTFTSVFPYLEIWDCGSGDIIMLGAQEPWESSLESQATLFSRAEPRSDLEQIGITSPAEMLARQLASQRTAFAIAGPGPVQSDAYPILEYEAPRAFYIGQESRCLERFDERTWMVALASPQKKEALTGLNDDKLRSVFGRFSTINQELRKQLAWRLRGGQADHPGRTPSMFLGAQEETVPADGPEEIHDLLRAVQQLRAEEAQRRAGVETIERLLRTHSSNSDWSTAYYAALAIKDCSARGDLAQASRILELGLKLTPFDETLQYLSRVLARGADSHVWQVSDAR